MASDQLAAPGSQPPAQVVGNAFVQQYYHILHTSPELVYRFYQESSKLSRPAPNGVMETVSNMQEINEKILAMDYSELKAEIKTVDAQESLEHGVIVMVTGYLTGKDLVKKDFTQSFFLAPQDKGFYVLNDLFRYVDENVEPIEKLDLPNGTTEALSLEEESPAPQEEIIQEQLPPSSIEEENDEEENEEENEEEVYNPPQYEVDHAVSEEEIPVEEVINEMPPVSEGVVAEAIPVPSAVTGEAPKKSYASIVQLMKANPAPISAPPPVLPRSAPTTVRSVSTTTKSTPVPAVIRGSVQSSDVPTGPSIDDNSDSQEAEADGHSIYVKSLPLNATPAQLEEEFKKFGPIKPNGVQVRSHKMQGFCFGFVDFEEASSVQSAIEASPILIGGRKAIVEEKRTTNSRSNNRGRFGSGRGGSNFHNDGSRGRGSGRGYSRSGSFNRGGGVRSGNSSPKSVNSTNMPPA